MDEYGCLRRGKNAKLVHKLGVTHHKPPRPDVIIEDAQQLLYHVVWPCGGRPSANKAQNLPDTRVNIYINQKPYTNKNV